MAISNEAMYGHRSSVNIVTGRAGPSYVIDGESIIVVDISFPSNAKAIVRFVQNVMRRDISDIKLVVLTHSHIDHTNGVDYMVDVTGATVAAHVNSKDYLTGRSAIPIPSWHYLAGFFHFLWSHGLPRPSLSDIFSMPWAGIPGIRKALKSKVAYWLEDAQRLPYNPEWQVIHTPGHTFDSICLYSSQERALITGDTIINLDGELRLNKLLQLDRRALMASLEKLKRLDIYYLYPGWGAPISGHGLIDRVQA
jgi:hydroxyacylglutathione hydrolase